MTLRQDTGTGASRFSSRGLTKRFGALPVLTDVDFSMEMGEAVGIVGPNGAGKTTFLATLAGSYPPSAGVITFAGRDVTRVSAADRCRMGLARTHQVPRPFSGMTTFENVYVAAAHAGDKGRDEAYAAVIDSLPARGTGSARPCPPR
ncbi:MAG: ATP-binding cassette domain-containing protein, partial [Rhizobium sp.]